MSVAVACLPASSVVGPAQFALVNPAQAVPGAVVS
jgi:hypothetical protein